MELNHLIVQECTHATVTLPPLVERNKGIEPPPPTWTVGVLPLHQSRLYYYG